MGVEKYCSIWGRSWQSDHFWRIIWRSRYFSFDGDAKQIHNNRKRTAFHLSNYLIGQFSKLGLSSNDSIAVIVQRNHVWFILQNRRCGMLDKDTCRQDLRRIFPLLGYIPCLCWILPYRSNSRLKAYDDVFECHVEEGPQLPYHARLEQGRWCLYGTRVSEKLW